MAPPVDKIQPRHDKPVAGKSDNEPSLAERVVHEAYSYMSELFGSKNPALTDAKAALNTGLHMSNQTLTVEYRPAGLRTMRTSTGFLVGDGHVVATADHGVDANFPDPKEETYLIPGQEFQNATKNSDGKLTEEDITSRLAKLPKDSDLAFQYQYVLDNFKGISEGKGGITQDQLKNWYKEHSTVDVITPDGTKYDASVLKTDSQDDVALLRAYIPSLEQPSLKPMPLSPTDPRPGDKLVALGHAGFIAPQNSPYKNQGPLLGDVAAAGTVVKSQLPQSIEIQGQIYPGMSGGPDIDPATGKVEGLNVAVSGDKSFLAPASAILRLLKTLPPVPKPNNNQPPPQFTAVL